MSTWAMKRMNGIMAACESSVPRLAPRLRPRTRAAAGDRRRAAELRGRRARRARGLLAPDAARGGAARGRRLDARAGDGRGVAGFTHPRPVRRRLRARRIPRDRSAREPSGFLDAVRARAGARLFRAEARGVP